MTPLHNDPSDFAREALDGFCAAHPDHVRQVHGGVVRAQPAPQGEVALVVGGGSGHYPAFAGWVGPGMAHGAVCGNVFASPSASQVRSVVDAAHAGAGVLLAFGHYAGDVLHFGQAAERLRAEGIDARILTISDDVASAPADRHRERRGIAGDLPVVKIVGAAAAAGASLDEAERLGWKAVEATRTLGVAFDGCTLPGQDQPLFTVGTGEMAVGLGIHGEAGVRDEPLRSAAAVADLLVDGVLAEEPARGAGYDGRAAVVLNGLGTVKYEELFVVYSRVAQRLARAGITAVRPHVGEFVTSLDMGGLSLTLVFLDEELEELWLAGADTPAYRQGDLPRSSGAGTSPRQPPTDVTHAPVPRSAPPSRDAAGHAVRVLGVLHRVTVEREQEFASLDAVAGDGDHGQGMRFGATGALRAAVTATESGAGLRTTLVRAGEAWAEAAGGTSGALWGAAITAVGERLSDERAPADEEVVDAVVAGGEAVLRLGGAEVGDKTMVDALLPFVEVLTTERGTPLVHAWARAADAATQGAMSTAEMVARRGRSRVLGERSLGTQDPGATSFAVLMSAVSEHLTTREQS